MRRARSHQDGRLTPVDTSKDWGTLYNINTERQGVNRDPAPRKLEWNKQATLEVPAEPRGASCTALSTPQSRSPPGAEGPAGISGAAPGSPGWGSILPRPRA